jgi:hypothetical protein
MQKITQSKISNKLKELEHNLQGKYSDLEDYNRFNKGTGFSESFIKDFKQKLQTKHRK